MTVPGAASPRLGLGANWRQFSVLVVVNAFVGAMVGLERSILPALAQQEFDLAGPERRGLAMGLNEFAGYLAVSLAALATGYVAASYGLRPWPFALGIGFVVAGFFLSLFVVRETHDHARHEALDMPVGRAGSLSQAQVFARTSLFDRDLSAISQAGLVNNLNDG